MKFFLILSVLAFLKLCRKLWVLEHGVRGVFGYNRGHDIRRSLISRLKVVVGYGQIKTHS